MFVFRISYFGILATQSWTKFLAHEMGGVLFLCCKLKCDSDESSHAVSNINLVYNLTFGETKSLKLFFNLISIAFKFGEK